MRDTGFGVPVDHNYVFLTLAVLAGHGMLFHDGTTQLGCGLAAGRVHTSVWGGMMLSSTCVGGAALFWLSDIRKPG